MMKKDEWFNYESSIKKESFLLYSPRQLCYILRKQQHPG